MLATLDQLATIGLESLTDAARLQSRLERKYIVGVATADALLQRLSESHRALVVHGQRVARYRTVYFDTPELMCFREHQQGRRRRFKCRRRDYLDTGSSVLELKVKASRDRTVKHAQGWTGTDDLDAAAQAFLRERLDSEYGRDLPSGLRPVLAIECRRVTLVALDGSERVTCDLSVRYQRHALATGVVIVETKRAGGRGRTDSTLLALGARPASSCSKYCLGMALGDPSLRANRMRQLIKRRFVAL